MMRSALRNANALPRAARSDGCAFAFFRDANLALDRGRPSDTNVVAVDFVRKVRSTADCETSEWKTIMADRFSRLRNYVAGWDGPASVAISPRALARAGRLLDLAFENVAFPAPPAAVPCADGSLQLEWWLADIAFELMVDADNSVQAFVENRISGEELEVSDDAAINLFLQWAGRLTADKLLPTA